MLAAKKNGAWITYDNREVYTKAQSIACGLIGNGLYSRQTDDPEAQVKIALISPNRPEWVILDLAVQMTGAILTPIYPTISNNEFEYVLNQAAVKAVFFCQCGPVQ